MSEAVETPAVAAPESAPAPRRRAFHPPLIALAPVLLVYAPNSGLLPAVSILRPLAMALGVGLALWLVAGAITRSWIRGATFASAVLVGFIAYSIVGVRLPFGPGTTRQIVYSMLALIAAGVLTWRIRDPRPLNFFSVLLFGLAIFQAGSSYLGHQGSESGRTATGGRAATSTPDVYYIVLDGFGRQDALKERVGFDDAFFIDGLRDLGFFVADKSRANYMQTELSLASSMNMEHLTTLFPVAPAIGDRRPFDRMITDSAVEKTFRSRGYRFLAVTTGFPAIDFPPAFSGYTPVGGFSLLETALMELTPLGERADFGGSQFVARRGWLHGAFDALDALAGDSGEPKFVFAHVLAPHPPFVLGPNGEVVHYETAYGYYDANDWTERNGSAEKYREGYRGQATWVAKQTLATVKRLISTSKTPPIVIVQGDHGPKSGLVQNSLNDTDLQEVVPNLNAYFVPKAIRGKLDPGITPVNSFRVIFSSLFGLDLPRLPDRSYFSPFAKPMELTDVTDRIK